MLSYLKITNFALIESSEVEFSGGFTVITGESGAGKSIMMSAVELLCGGRGGRGGIRSGCDKCTICGIFTVPAETAAAIAPLLADGGIELPDNFSELTLRRVIGKSSTRNFIEDIPVSARLLAEVGAYLVDLHGANEHLSLMVPARQLELLDNYAGLHELRAKCAAIAGELNLLTREISEFDAGLPDSAEADRLQLILEEIDRLDPQPGEDEELAARQRRGANARNIIETANMLSDLLTEGENSVADHLGTVYHHLSSLENIDASLTGDLPARCADIQDNISSISNAILNLADKVDLDPEALAAVEARLSEIYTLKRRYGPTLEQVLTTRERAAQQLSQYASAKKQRQLFAEKRQSLNRALADAAQELSNARKKCAGEFLAAATAKLKAIGFNSALLDARFTAIAPGANGMDQLELLFCANSGEELAPLRKIASSGELSRLMLALKTVLADADSVPTVIFDEIDMNIGGETANCVGDELRALGKKRQILCISHLAQVAARADEHFQVAKSTENDRTVSRVCKLTDPTPELARMLGGGSSALRHARELRKNLAAN